MSPAVTPKERPLAVVGLGGWARSGKDVIADELVNGYGWVKVGMSDALNDALLALDPIVEPYTGWSYSDHLKRCGGDYAKAKKLPEVRNLLQRLGTDVVRDLIDPDAWVKLTLRTIGKLHEAGHDKIVVTGIRFKNELKMIQELNGWPIWVSRSTVDPANSHPSEFALNPLHFSLEVANDGDDFVAPRQRAHYINQLATAETGGTDGPTQV